MSYASLVLGKNWCHYEWPEYVSVSHLMSAEPARRYVPERTCHLEFINQNERDSVGDGVCSNCGNSWDWVGDYCSCCGAKAVEE